MGLAGVFARITGRGSKLELAELRHAKPKRKPDVTEETDDDGKTFLSVPAPKVSGIQKWFAKPHRFELEPIGADVWNKIDGRHSVETIAKSLASKHKMNLREAEVALLAFLETLGRRGLITLELPNRKGKRR